MAVDTPSQDYLLTQVDREITQHLRGGTRFMRTAGKAYLPQEPLESEQLYRNRLHRSFLTNFYRKTADIFGGKILRKEPAVLESTPEQIADLEEDIDNRGNDISTFIAASLDHGIDDGIVHYFVDSPNMPKTVTGEDKDQGEAFPRTKGQDTRGGLRPYVSLVTASNLIGWKSELVNGDDVLTQIRIREIAMEADPDDVWNEVSIEQIRVVEPFSQTIWQLRSNAQGKEVWMVVDRIITDFEKIPLVTMYTNKVKFMVGEPLFLDLAYLNLDHWQQNSDQTNIVHTIRIPILFGTGLAEAGEQPGIDIGANSLVHAEVGSTLTYVEHTGKAAEVGYVSLERLEQNITRMGADIVMNKRTASDTATARALDQAEVDTEMTVVATAIENAWSEIFILLAEAFGIVVADDDDEAAGGLNLNKDFNLAQMDMTAVGELIKMRQANDLSQATLWEELVRMGVLSEDFDPEAEVVLLEGESEESMERDAEMLALTATSGGINPDPFESGGNGDDEEDDDDD